MITSPNGRRMMIDCGTNFDRLWWPSIQFMNQTIDVLAISNFDEDHVADFLDVKSRCTLLRYQFNNSITADVLAQMKAGTGMREGIQAVHVTLKSFETGSGYLPQLDFGPVQYRVYYNWYGQDFIDTNNLSLVLIFEYAGFKIIFPGDLEQAGWKKLLEDTNFVIDLLGVDVFVASHHGRVSGCCEEVFNIWKPQIIIMSDKDKEFDSQETVPWYRYRSTGIWHGNEMKYVYTTRNNGHMLISVQSKTDWIIRTEK